VGYFVDDVQWPAIIMFFLVVTDRLEAELAAQTMAHSCRKSLQHNAFFQHGCPVKIRVMLFGHPPMKFQDT